MGTKVAVRTVGYRLWVPPEAGKDKHTAHLMWTERVNEWGFAVVGVPTIEVVNGDYYVVGVVTPEH